MNIDFGGFLTMSPRELDIVRLMAEGGSGKEIARALNIAPCTVERHIENARLKTRTRNRSHLVAFAVRNGLLTAGAGRNAMPLVEVLDDHSHDRPAFQTDWLDAMSSTGGSAFELHIPAAPEEAAGIAAA